MDNYMITLITHDDDDDEDDNNDVLNDTTAPDMEE